MAENARAKGLRYLTEGRLCVTRVDDDDVEAHCRGDSGEVYECGHVATAAHWYCSCPARRRCAHLHALMAVTIRNRKEAP